MSAATLSPIIQQLIKDTELADADLVFLLEKGKQLMVDADTVHALIRLELFQSKPDATQSQMAPLGRFIRALVNAGSVVSADKQLLKQKGKELGLPDAFTDLLITTITELRPEHQAALHSLDSLARAAVQIGLHRDADKAYITEEAIRAQLAPVVVDALMQYEQAVLHNQLPIAHRVLNDLVAHVRSQNGGMTVAKALFINEKLNELAQLEGTEQPSRTLVMGKATSVQAREAQMQDNAQQKVITQTSTIKAHTAGLSETVVYEIDETNYILKRSSLHSHASGLSWFVQLAHKTKANEGWAVINGVQHDLLTVNELCFSNDGSHYAYKVRKDKHEQVIMDGKAGDLFGAVGELTFSPDSKAFAYIGKNGPNWQVVLNGEPSKPHAGIRDITFNPKSNKPTYVVVEAKKWHVLHDGKVDQGYLASGEFTYSKDGSKLAYWAKNGPKTFAVVNGEKGPDFDGVGDFTFSPDGSRLAYAVNSQGKVGVLFDGKATPLYDRVWGIQYSPDNKKLYFMANAAGEEFLVINGTAEGKYKQVNGLCFSPDQSSYAYWVSDGKRKAVILNGNPGEPYEEVARVSFNPRTGSLLYFGFRDKQWYLVTDGKESEPYNGTEELQYAADTGTTAFIGRISGKWNGIVIDGVRKYEWPSPKHLLLNEDGTRAACCFFKKEGWYFVINDQVKNAQPYTEILVPPRYDRAKDQFYFLARQGATVLTVTIQA